uniref:Uncharacterized protein n=1 Tax=Cacopsylla melanoneura TaxID=428564 RepID=A0A8D8RMN4_9HEMI
MCTNAVTSNHLTFQLLSRTSVCKKYLMFPVLLFQELVHYHGNRGPAPPAAAQHAAKKAKTAAGAQAQTAKGAKTQDKKAAAPAPEKGAAKPVRVCYRCFIYQVTPFTTLQPHGVYSNQQTTTTSSSS